MASGDFNGGGPAVGTLITSRETADACAVVQDVVDRLFQQSNLEALAVLQEGRLAGLAMRSKLLARLFRRYGFELYGRKQILALADVNPLVVAPQEGIGSVLERAMARPPEDVYDDIVVVEGDGRFVGLISVKQMILQQSVVLANTAVQREIATARAQDLERVGEVKAQFIANVTHELRSPVNAILELGELMAISCRAGYVDQLQDRLRLLLSTAGNLRSIITNILDLSKIQAGKMMILPEAFEIGEVLAEVGDTTRILLGEKPVSVYVEVAGGPVQVNTDPVKVRQMLTNLTSNAAKFTERGTIRIVARKEGGDLLLRVSDSGIGIARKDLDALFVAFSQVENVHTKRYEGTGLGLSITKQLAEMLGGGVSVASRAGEGTEFTIRIPATFKGDSHEPNAEEKVRHDHRRRPEPPGLHP